jgi:hypothetical protein
MLDEKDVGDMKCSVKDGRQVLLKSTGSGEDDTTEFSSPQSRYQQAMPAQTPLKYRKP